MYQPLEVDFEIPEYIEQVIEEYLDDLNHHGGRMEDCYRYEIRNDINCYAEDLTEEQAEILRDYYVRGGIYATAD